MNKVTYLGNIINMQSFNARVNEIFQGSPGINSRDGRW